MPLPDKALVRNRLLRAMDDADFARLSSHLVPLRTEKSFVLFERNEVTRDVWFLEDGIGSIVTTSPEGLMSENGLFGRDGFAPVSIVMGSDRCSHRGLIQVAGDAWRVPVEVFGAALAESENLRKLMLRFAHALSVQTAYTALSNAVHQIDERLARWLLMTHDRVNGDELPLTHDFMAIMLGVRRPSVTTALHTLEGNGFIRAERGCVVLRDRGALEDFAGDSYGPPEAEYERLIGPLRK